MRCLSCNVALSDFESTRKSANTNMYLDLCNKCYYTITDDVASIERADLEHDYDQVVDDDFVDSLDLSIDDDD